MKQINYIAILPFILFIILGCNYTEAEVQFSAPRNDHDRLHTLEQMFKNPVNLFLSRKELLSAGLGSEYYYSYHLEANNKIEKAFELALAGIENNNPWFEYNTLRAYNLSNNKKEHLILLRKQIRKLNGKHQTATGVLYVLAQIAYHGGHFKESLQFLHQMDPERSRALNIDKIIQELELLNNIQLKSPFWQKSLEEYLLTWPLPPHFTSLVDTVKQNSNHQEWIIIPLLSIMEEMQESPNNLHFTQIMQYIENWGAGKFFHDYPSFARIYIQYAGQANLRTEAIAQLQEALRDKKSLSPSAYFELNRGIAVMQWRLGRYQMSSELFASLLDLTNNQDDYNDILWYYLFSLYRHNSQEFIQTIQNHRFVIKENARWFDDFFQTLLRDLTATENFADLAIIHQYLIKNQATLYMQANYGWTLARAMHHNFLPKSTTSISNHLHEALLDPWSYPAFMAATELNELPPLFSYMTHHNPPTLAEITDKNAILKIDQDSLTRMTFASTVATSPTITPDLHLLGFFYYNLSDLAIKQLRQNPKNLQLDTIRLLARGLHEEKRYLESIRVMNIAKNFDFFQPDREDFMTLYPLAFFDEIDHAAKSINLATNIYMALIRTESGFSPEIQSRVAATGLAQIMPATAKDMAMRLKIPESEIDLTNVEQNLLLSSQYLYWIQGRMDGLYAQLAGYNGGPNRVRRWREEWKNLPDELFIEAIPYTETRNYVKSIAVSAAIYQYLYNKEAPIFVIGEIFPSFHRSRLYAPQ